MSKRDPETAWRQILAHAREAVALTQGKTRADLDQDRLLNLALTRLVEILGEAANRIPEEVQAQYPELPWLQMIGARNRLIHGYDNVDFDILWAIVSHDLPVLISQFEYILN
jgi:uncharacterized protein with HEPN domain